MFLSANLFALLIFTVLVGNAPYFWYAHHHSASVKTFIIFHMATIFKLLPLASFYELNDFISGDQLANWLFLVFFFCSLCRYFPFLHMSFFLQPFIERRGGCGQHFRQFFFIQFKTILHFYCNVNAKYYVWITSFWYKMIQNTKICYIWTFVHYHLSLEELQNLI